MPLIERDGLVRHSSWNPMPLPAENQKSLGPRLRGDDDFIIHLLKVC